MSDMSLFSTIEKGWYAYGGFYIQKRSPVIIYAPGRVGSMPLQKDLRSAGIFSFKVEDFLSPGVNNGLAKFATDRIVNSDRPYKIVTLVRDPVGQMISYFYGKAYYGHIPESKEALNDMNVEKLQDIFINEVLKTNRLDSHLYWFENKFIPQTKVDIFEHRFDTENKFSSIENTKNPILIMRTDLEDDKKSQYLQNFLNNKNISISRGNVRTEKKGGETYEEFKHTIKIPQEILDKVYTSKLCLHFFSKKEIKDLRKSWS